MVDLERRRGSDAAVASARLDRWIDRIDRRLVWLLTALGFAIPVAWCLWLVRRYGIDVVTGDQWSDVAIIQSSYHHFFDWSLLWAQHNENRIFFPNALVLLQSRTVHFNIKLEEYISAVLLFCSVTLVLLTHRRRAPYTPWLYYCPVAFLMLSLVQCANLLWGFQIAYYVVLVATVLCLFLLDRYKLGWFAYVSAVSAAVVASYSSLQGLLVWPVGVLLIYHRRRAWPFVTSWIVLAALTTLLYLHNFNLNGGRTPQGAAFRHPLESVKFFLTAIGDVLGVPFNAHQDYDPLMVLFGGLIVVAAVGVIIVYGVRRDDRSGGPYAVALLVFGLLFAATVTQGRVVFGAAGAAASRYATFDLIVPVGIYLALLDRPVSKVATKNRDATDNREQRGLGLGLQPLLLAARAFIGLVIVLQLGFGLSNGIESAKVNYAYQSHAVVVLRQIDHEPNYAVALYLDLFGKPSYIRNLTKTLQEHHLSVFGHGG